MSVVVTKDSASYKGMPRWSVNSSGAAPVPPSAPSTAIKSGNIWVVSMALQISINSCLSPIHNLKPTGLYPDSSRNCWMKFIMPSGRSEEHTSELQSRENLVCRLLLEKKKEVHMR